MVIRAMARSKKDIVERYIRVRIDSLWEEREKNNNEIAHMVLDKAVSELTYVLELMQKHDKDRIR